MNGNVNTCYKRKGSGRVVAGVYAVLDEKLFEIVH
jgi:hypothetical protein